MYLFYHHEFLFNNSGSNGFMRKLQLGFGQYLQDCFSGSTSCVLDISPMIAVTDFRGVSINDEVRLIPIS